MYVDGCQARWRVWLRSLNGGSSPGVVIILRFPYAITPHRQSAHALMSFHCLPFVVIMSTVAPCSQLPLSTTTTTTLPASGMTVSRPFSCFLSPLTGFSGRQTRALPMGLSSSCCGRRRKHNNNERSERTPLLSQVTDPAHIRAVSQTAVDVFTATKAGKYPSQDQVNRAVLK